MGYFTMNRTALASLAAASTLLAAASALPAGETGAESYAACMALARSDPEAGFGEAVTWEELGGGTAARHCAAVALTGLGEYGEAAQRFETLAQTAQAPDGVRTNLLAQAARAWLLAGAAERAESVLDAAIKRSPDDPQLYIDRAEARAGMDRYAGAAVDLDTALRLDPDDAQALALRASARRRLGDIEDALLDAEEAVQIDPASLPALLERGILRRLAGDDSGARADWLRILRIDADSPQAKAARDELERLDVKVR